MSKIQSLISNLTAVLSDSISAIDIKFDEVTFEVTAENLKNVMTSLRDNESLKFDQLMDVCAVDYLLYGISDWQTESATESGFCRGVERMPQRAFEWDKPRFAVVYHLLSTVFNSRVRVKVFLQEDNPVIASVHDIWQSANWFEREAYDLYGILFENHPDLRRILTDYGFIGHPFRKDFPLSGHVEMRYDATLGQVIYEAVDIEPRVVIPKVIREDSRYISPQVDANE